MKILELYCEVLHGEPKRALMSVPKNNPDADFYILAHKVTEFQRLHYQGIAQDRIKFTVEERTI